MQLRLWGSSSVQLCCSEGKQVTMRGREGLVLQSWARAGLGSYRGEWNKGLWSLGRETQAVSLVTERTLPWDSLYLRVRTGHGKEVQALQLLVSCGHLCRGLLVTSALGHLQECCVGEAIAGKAGRLLYRAGLGTKPHLSDINSAVTTVDHRPLETWGLQVVSMREAESPVLNCELRHFVLFQVNIPESSLCVHCSVCWTVCTECTICTLGHIHPCRTVGCPWL